MSLSLIQGLLVQKCNPSYPKPPHTPTRCSVRGTGPAAASQPPNTPQDCLFPGLFLPRSGGLPGIEAIGCFDGSCAGFSVGTFLGPTPAPPGPLIPHPHPRLCQSVRGRKAVQRSGGLQHPWGVKEEGGPRAGGQDPVKPHNLRRKRMVLKGPLQDLLKQIQKPVHNLVLSSRLS